MPKVLAKAGVSLADIYDVEGSIAGVSQLISRDVSLLHEMGATIFSERLIGEISRQETGDILQNVTWNLTVLVPPAGIYRVVGVQVLADTAARVSIAQVSLRSLGATREIPIFVWDQANDPSSGIRIVDDGAATATMQALIQTSPVTMPSLGIGRGQASSVGDQIVFRGLTLGFGAGTVEAVALVYLASSRTTSISSVGLPIPAW